jgi:hypothetical protein
VFVLVPLFVWAVAASVLLALEIEDRWRGPRPKN